MAVVPIEARTDREVLLLVARDCAESKENIKEINTHLRQLNGSVTKNTQRLADLPCKGGTGCGTEPNGSKSRRILRDNWPTITLAASLLGLILVEVAGKL